MSGDLTHLQPSGWWWNCNLITNAGWPSNFQSLLILQFKKQTKKSIMTNYSLVYYGAGFHLKYSWRGFSRTKWETYVDTGLRTWHHSTAIIPLQLILIGEFSGWSCSTCQRKDVDNRHGELPRRAVEGISDTKMSPILGLAKYWEWVHVESLYLPLTLIYRFVLTISPTKITVRGQSIL